MQLGQRHGWHGTFVLYCSHRTSTCFCSPSISKILVCEGHEPKWLRRQTETPRREEWVGFFFLQVSSRTRGLRRLMGTSFYAWMPLPSPWGLISITGVGVSRVLRETTMGLVNSGNCVLHTITIYEGYIRPSSFFHLAVFSQRVSRRSLPSKGTEAEPEAQDEVNAQFLMQATFGLTRAVCRNLLASPVQEWVHRIIGAVLSDSIIVVFEELLPFVNWNDHSRFFVPGHI